VKPDRLGVFAVNPCPVEVVIRLSLSVYSAAELLLQWEETIQVPPNGKGFYFFSLPIFLSVIGTYSYYYKAEFFASEVFETPEGDYLIGKCLFVSPLPWVA
jgi:hypothetical protein